MDVGGDSTQGADETADRRRMVRHDLAGRDIRDPRVLEAMARVPRERFVPADLRAQAYDDRPLPIGLGQTISQPYIVALMTQILEVTADMDVLEIGTGSGYQTAVLAYLARRVYTVERWEALSGSARQTLAGLGLGNVEFGVADGSLGWPVARVFDRVLVTAAVPQVPGPLWDQLKVGGRWVGPVGGEMVQTLTVADKTDAETRPWSVCAVRFVRLIGEHGFSA